MKTTVTFRVYELPSINPETSEEERGEFLFSFLDEFEGPSAVEVNEKVACFLSQYQEKENVDIRVWEVKQ